MKKLLFVVMLALAPLSAEALPRYEGCKTQVVEGLRVERCPLPLRLKKVVQLSSYSIGGRMSMKLVPLCPAEYAEAGKACRHRGDAHECVRVCLLKVNPTRVVARRK